MSRQISLDLLVEFGVYEILCGAIFRRDLFMLLRVFSLSTATFQSLQLDICFLFTVYLSDCFSALFSTKTFMFPYLVFL
jgi:hypothetical protein